MPFHLFRRSDKPFHLFKRLVKSCGCKFQRKSYDDFIHASVITLNDRLGFDNWLYPKSFMSFMRTKDYTYMVINDGKVSIREFLCILYLIEDVW